MAAFRSVLKLPSMWQRGHQRCISLSDCGAANVGNSARPGECRACVHEDSAVRGRAVDRLPGQEPAEAAARAESADPQGSIFRHFGVQSPK